MSWDAGAAGDADGRESLAFDVVVIGSGAAGLTTAIVAGLSGLKVLVVEKTAWFGGTTAYSGGAPWIPCNHHMTAFGQEDDVETAMTYLRSVLGNYFDDAKIAAFVESGPEMIALLERKTDVAFYPIPIPDYFPDNPGARVGRTMLTREYDGRALGKMIRALRNPLPGFAVFGTMQVDAVQSGEFKKAFRTWRGFRLASGRFLSFLRGKLTHGKGTHLANGNALAGRLLHSAMKAGVTLWNNTAAVQTLQEGGQVVGVAIVREGREISIRARRGVVLASGGFGGDPGLTAQHMPMPEAHISVFPEGNVGDGIRMGQAAGGAMGPDNPDNGVWAPVSVLRNDAGDIVAKYPHFGPDRAKPGSIIVDGEGRRFVNEAAPYQPFVNRMHERRIRTAWFIAGRAYLRNYGMGLALPAPLPMRRHVQSGYLIEADTLEALAARIGVDGRTLVETIERFNRDAAEERDPEFLRGANIYDHSQGDWEIAPRHPNLAPVGPGPYYALALHPGNVSSVLGLATSPDAEVLDMAGQVVPGLFAVGLDQNTAMRGFYPGGGSGIGPAMTFGYRAARKIAGVDFMTI